MIKYVYMTLFLFFLAAPTNRLYGQKVENQIGYPILDITVGTGFMWLFQANLSIAPIKNIYIQSRISAIPLVAYELGGMIGFQTRYQDKKILRLGLGYSHGEISYFYIGDSKNKNEIYKSVYIRLDLIYDLNKYIIFNPNINITRFDKRPIFSANFTVGYCLFR